MQPAAVSMCLLGVRVRWEGNERINSFTFWMVLKEAVAWQGDVCHTYNTQPLSAAFSYFLT